MILLVEFRVASDGDRKGRTDSSVDSKDDSKKDIVVAITSGILVIRLLLSVLTFNMAKLRWLGHSTLRVWIRLHTEGPGRT